MPPKLTIELMRAIARDRGGECLSGAYTNCRTRLRWRCSKGHEWEALPSNVKRGRWCLPCADTRLEIGAMQRLALERGGECLSASYVNNWTKLRWKCSKGHEWEASPTKVKGSGRWCPQCAGNAKLTIEKMRALALERGGECLSSEYINVNAKLSWRCAHRHEWSATPDNVKYGGNWCPYCRYKNEQRCRETFEALTQKSFPKCKPKWLQGLELDGYCEELGIAFEYQGEQHYKVVRAWHENGEEDLEAQQARDRKKTRLCDENWVALIAIPYDTADKRALIQREIDLLL